MGATSPTGTSKSKMAAPHISGSECCGIWFISTSVLCLIKSDIHMVLSNFCGHVDTVFVSTKYHAVNCYQLVLLTWLTWLEQSILVFLLVILERDLISSSNIQQTSFPSRPQGVETDWVVQPQTSNVKHYMCSGID